MRRTTLLLASVFLLGVAFAGCVSPEDDTDGVSESTGQECPEGTASGTTTGTGSTTGSGGMSTEGGTEDECIPGTTGTGSTDTTTDTTTGGSGGIYG